MREAGKHGLPRCAVTATWRGELLNLQRVGGLGATPENLVIAGVRCGFMIESPRPPKELDAALRLGFLHGLAIGVRGANASASAANESGARRAARGAFASAEAPRRLRSLDSVSSSPAQSSTGLLSYDRALRHGAFLGAIGGLVAAVTLDNTIANGPDLRSRRRAWRKAWLDAGSREGFACWSEGLEQLEAAVLRLRRAVSANGCGAVQVGLRHKRARAGTTQSSSSGPLPHRELALMVGCGLVLARLFERHRVRRAGASPPNSDAMPGGLKTSARNLTLAASAAACAAEAAVETVAEGARCRQVAASVDSWCWLEETDAEVLLRCSELAEALVAVSVPLT